MSFDTKHIFSFTINDFVNVIQSGTGCGLRLESKTLVLPDGKREPINYLYENGMLYDEPVYFREFTHTAINGNDTYDISEFNTASIFSVPDNFERNVSYSKVSVIYPDHGKEVYTFSSDNEEPNLKFVFSEQSEISNQLAFIDNANQRGHLLKKETFNQSNSLLLNEEYLYDDYNDSIPEIRGIRINYSFNPPVMDAYAYTIPAPRRRAGVITTKAYFDDPNFPVTRIDTTRYDEFGRFTKSFVLPTYSSHRNSDSTLFSSKSFYLDSYPDTSISNAMLTNMQWQPWKVEKYANDGSGNILTGGFENEISFYLYSTGEVIDDPVLETFCPVHLYKHKRYEATWDENGTYILDTATQFTIKKYDYNLFDPDFSTRPEVVNINGWNDDHRYDWTGSGKIKADTFINYLDLWEYNDKDLLEKRTFIDGTSESFEYDLFLRLDKHSHDQCGWTKNYVYHYATSNTDHNYVQESTDFDLLGNKPGTITNRSYIGGDGRHLQTLRVNQDPDDPNGHIAVSTTLYDTIGRPIVVYEPWTVSALGYADPSGQTDFTESFYEPGPLGRIDSVITPQWYARKAIREINQANEIPDLNNGGHYAKGTLFKAVSVDENGNKKITYADFHGDGVAMRQESKDGTEQDDTYTRYDLKKNKVQIIPPGVITAQTTLQFNYLYYGNGQMARRDLPDSDPINYVYNQRDQLSYRQDGNMQDSSRWWGTIYDEYGNVSIEGWFNGNPGGNGSFDNASLSQLRIFNIWSDTDDITKGKLTKNQSIFLMTDEFSETDYFYDNCGRLEEESNTIYNDNITLFTNSLYPKYDSRNEVYESRHILRDHNLDFHIITKHFDFDHRGSIIGESFQYGFDNPIIPLTSKSYTPKEQVKSVVFSPQNPLANVQYEYLPNGFLKKMEDPLFTMELFYDQTFDQYVTPRKNGDISTLLWQHRGEQSEAYVYNYDFKDQLSFAEFRHPETNQGPFFHALYEYDPRGNRTYYEIAGGNVNPNIQESSNDDMQGMRYHYFPNTNKLSHIEYVAAKGVTKSAFTTREYDSNGNVTRDQIERSPTLNDVHYDYNFLNKANRTWIDANNYVDYYYDASGQQHRKKVVENGQVVETRDYVRGVELVNGEIDLIHFSDGFIKFRNGLDFTENLNLTHMAIQDSIHLAGTITSTSTVANQSDVTYMAEDCITMDTGFHVMDSTEFAAVIDTVAQAYEDIEIYYTIKDHLGSTRVVISDLNLDGSIDTSEILQVNDYYPFGAGHSDNKTGSYAYRYNGKEKELALGLLDLRFEARTMSVLAGSFNGVDPISDAFPHVSPYNYAQNNPSNGVDFWGLQLIHSAKSKIYFHNGGASLKSSNLFTPTQNRINNADIVAGVDSRGQSFLTTTFPTRIGSLNFNSGRANEKRKPPTFQQLVTQVASTKPAGGNSAQRRKWRRAIQGIGLTPGQTTTTPLPGGRGKGLPILWFIAEALNGSANSAVNYDLNTAKEQYQNHNTLLEGIMDFSTQNGLIPLQFNDDRSKTDIANYIFQGEFVNEYDDDTFNSIREVSQGIMSLLGIPINCENCQQR